MTARTELRVIRRGLRGAALLMVLACLPALASDGAPPAADDGLLRIWQPDGRSQSFSLQSDGVTASLVSGRAHVTLPLPAERVLGFGVVPQGLLAQLRAQPGAAVTLNGARHDQRFIPGELALATPADETRALVTAPAIPLYTPLLPRLTPVQFGSEQRASIVAAAPGVLHLHCDAGRQPAGLLLTGPLRGTLDRLGGGLRFRARANARFEVGVSDRRRTDRQEPVLVGELSGNTRDASLDLTLPGRDWDPSEWRSITLSCPPQGGDLELSGLEAIVADAAPAHPSRALWVWDPQAWRVHARELLGLARTTGARELFLTLPLADEECAEGACQVADGGPLRDFLAGACGAGIRVWAVMGDPYAVLQTEHSAWQTRVRAVAGLNRSLPAACRLAGLQFDIEPYLIPGYDLHARDWNHRYLDLLAEMRLAAPQLAIDVVVPWWLGEADAVSAELLEALVPLVSRLTVMDYRTDPALLRRSALPFIKWAQRHQRDVRVALEYGPLPDEEARRYAVAAKGELWIGMVDRQPLYVLFDQPVPAPGGIILGALDTETVPASRTTFFDRPEALWQAVEGVENDFSATQAFAGVAIHGLDHAWY